MNSVSSCLLLAPNVNFLVHVWILDAELLCLWLLWKPWCAWLTVFSVAHIPCCWNSYVMQSKPSLWINCRTIRPTSHSIQAKIQSHSKKIPLYPFFILNAVPAVWRHVQHMLHAQTYRFSIWNSIAVIRGSLWVVIWPKEPLGISHVNLDLLGDIHCSVKDEPISHTISVPTKRSSCSLQQQMGTFLSDVQLSL